MTKIIHEQIPAFLSRGDVPRYFPQFKGKYSLAHLAHKRVGPLYNLISGQAFYAAEDICAWLEKTKQPGPNSRPIVVPNLTKAKSSANKSVARKVGRPTKAEQMAKKQR